MLCKTRYSCFFYVASSILLLFYSAHLSQHANQWTKTPHLWLAIRWTIRTKVYCVFHVGNKNIFKKDNNSRSFYEKCNTIFQGQMTSGLFCKHKPKKAPVISCLKQCCILHFTLHTSLIESRNVYSHFCEYLFNIFQM